MKHSCSLMGILLVLVLSLSACGRQDYQKMISKELGIEISDGKTISVLDTHGGFFGDGTTCIAIECSRDNVLEQIRENAQWQSFPPDDTVTALLYGKSDETSTVGPYLTDGDGEALVPYIQNGYYLLTDRHTDAGEGEAMDDILKRSSFNFTLGVYDSDTKILYFCKLDT